MSRYSGDEDYTHGNAETVGVLVVNLGTPDEATPGALRRYLAEFLWDPRIVEIPRPIWWLILHGIILRLRPAKSAHAYQTVWREDGAPLLSISRQQVQALQSALRERHPAMRVELAMRYGNPSIVAGLEKLRQANARRVLVLPLYPQYSGTTTASTFDAVANVFKTWRWVPELRFVNQYHDDDGYIRALANSIKEAWAEQDQPDKLLFSFHGTPKRFLLSGDPYHCMCQKTARLVAEQLALPTDRWAVAFQSRFGRAEWLQPYTMETLQQWGRAGIKNVHVICPGFSADCLETLEEIKLQNRDAFLSSGGEQFDYIPALNDRPDHIQALSLIIEKHMQGWNDILQKAADETSKSELDKSRERALAMGAKR
jgi:ferrochelatase